MDELIEHDFNESMKYSPYNEKYSFKEINNKITLPFLSSLYLITEEYNHHLERRYSVDKIRDDIKQAALCYMRKDCGIDVGAELEYYHLGIELLNGRRLIEFLDSPADEAVPKSSKSLSPSSTTTEIDTSQERYKDYMDFVLKLLNDEDSHGVIDNEEREMLKTKQNILKLTDIEAKNIEDSVINNFQNKYESERKYKEDVSRVLGENSEISAKQRMRLDLSSESFGISPEVAKKCEEEVIREIKTKILQKIEDYRIILREKLKGSNEVSPKTRMYLDLKIEELGLSKDVATKCEEEVMTSIDGHWIGFYSNGVLKTDFSMNISTNKNDNTFIGNITEEKKLSLGSDTITVHSTIINGIYNKTNHQIIFSQKYGGNHLTNYEGVLVSANEIRGKWHSGSFTGTWEVIKK